MSPARRRLAAILFSDIVGYTALMAEDETQGVQARRRHRDLVRERVARFGGRFIEERGDETLASFASAVQALNCALAIQQSLASEDFQVRMGLHVGDVVFDARRIYGDGVNVAARIRELAGPGEIFVSGDVHHAVRSQPNLEFEARGERELKNVPHPVPLFAVRGEPSAAPSAEPRRARRAAALTAALAGAALLVVWALDRGDGSSGSAGVGELSATAATPSAAGAIAVLPFTDMSGDHSQEHFSDGLTEEIINALAQVEGLRVVARTSAFAFKGNEADARTIGARLRVASLVEGSVRHANGRFRITAQLVNARDGYHVWSNTFERPVQDVFTVQEEIASAIVEALQGELEVQLAVPKVEVATTDFRAYEHYLKGRAAHRRAAGVSDLKEAVAHFQRALEVDGGYSLAYAGLADAYGTLWDFLSEDQDGFHLAAAEEAARRAVDLGPAYAETRTALGEVALMRWAWRDAEAELRRAIQLNSGYARAHERYASLLLIQARLPEARAEIYRALEADFLAPTANRNAGRFHLYAGEPAEAIPFLERTLELNPGDPDTPRLLWHAYHGVERAEDARNAYSLMAPRPLRPVLSLLARGIGEERTLRLGYTVEKLRAGSDPCLGRPWGAAQTLAQVHETEQMFECLERASRPHLWYIQLDPEFAPYRSDPRYRELLERVGLAPPEPASDGRAASSAADKKSKGSSRSDKVLSDNSRGDS